MKLLFNISFGIIALSVGILLYLLKKIILYLLKTEQLEEDED